MQTMNCKLIPVSRTSALTCDVYVRRVVQYVGTAMPELLLIECTVAQYYNISSKADRGDILIGQ